MIINTQEPTQPEQTHWKTFEENNKANTSSPTVQTAMQQTQFKD